MNFNLIDHKDILGCKSKKERPENGNRGSDEGDVDFEKAEEIDERCIEGDVKDRIRAQAMVEQRYNASDCA